MLSKYQMFHMVVQLPFSFLQHCACLPTLTRHLAGVWQNIMNSFSDLYLLIHLLLSLPLQNYFVETTYILDKYKFYLLIHPRNHLEENIYDPLKRNS